MRTKPFHLELSRFWRRVLVVLLYALYSGLLTFWAFLPFPLPPALVSLTQGLSVAGFALMILAALVLYAATGGVADISDHDFSPSYPSPLDERQEKVRNRAYLPAYLILGPSLLVLIFSAEKVAPLWLVAAGLFLYAALPVAVLAWLEPDPPREDFEERTLA